MNGIERDAPLQRAKAPVFVLNGGHPMSMFSRIFGSHRQATLTTRLERQRLSKTMPGQTAALTAARLGCLVM